MTGITDAISSRQAPLLPVRTNANPYFRQGAPVANPDRGPSLSRSMLSESLADASRTALPAWAKAIVAGTIVRAGRVLSSPISLVFEHKQGASALSEAGQVVLDLRSIRHALSAAGVPAAAMETLPFQPGQIGGVSSALESFLLSILFGSALSLFLAPLPCPSPPFSPLPLPLPLPLTPFTGIPFPPSVFLPRRQAVMHPLPPLPLAPPPPSQLVEREKTGAMFLDPDVARSSVAPRAPRRQRRLCKGPGVFARLLCMRDSQPRLYKRTPRGYEREPMEDSRGGCLGMAKLVSVGTQTDNDGE